MHQDILDKINELSVKYNIPPEELEDFAEFAIAKSKEKVKKPSQKKVKSLTLGELKEAIYKYFEVANTKELQKSGSYRMATEGMKPQLKSKDGWEALYRKFIGVLPGEEQEEGYGCINGVNVFKYFMSWKVFGLNGETATEEEVKTAYRNLSKIYHPDNSETGDRAVFERLTVMYKSILPVFEN